MTVPGACRGGADIVGRLATLDCGRTAPKVSAMATLSILEFPDPRLRTRARALEETDFTPALQQLIDDMFETMYAAPGIGLAATQVDCHLRFMVMDISEEKTAPLVFINPEILSREGEQVYQEGCLSVPGIFADVSRADHIAVRALDRHGKPFELQAEGLLAVCIQHEIDHLEGKVFVDYLSPLKREMVRKRLAKQKRASAA
jgi:peptide deformylase